MNKEATNYLIKKYWFFQPDPTLQNNLMAFGFECGDGWFKIIDELCWVLEDEFNTSYLDYKEDFVVLQVKEKYGGLCFYVSSAPNEIHDIIDFYCELSNRICEWCGKDGENKSYNGWYITLCSECEEKYRKGRGIEHSVCDG